MPFLKKRIYKRSPAKRVYRKKAYRKKRYYRKRKFSPSRSVIPLHPMKIMRYCDTVQLATSVGTTTNFFYRCASIFAPQYSILTPPNANAHKPLGYDQMSTEYWHYTVVGSKINVKFMAPPVGSGLATQPMVGILLNPTTTGVTNVRTLMESKTGQYRQLGNFNSGLTTASITSKFSPKKQFQTKSIVGNDQWTCNFGNNPNEEMYFNIWIAPPDVTVAVGDVTCVVTIDYAVVFTEPKLMAESILDKICHDYDVTEKPDHKSEKKCITPGCKSC